MGAGMVCIGGILWLVWSALAFQEARKPRVDDTGREVRRSLFVAIPLAAVLAAVGIYHLWFVPAMNHVWNQGTGGGPPTPQPPHVLADLLPAAVPLPAAIAGTALLVVFVAVLAVRLRGPAESD